MGKPSRDKGARGERRAADFFKRLGLFARRVSSLETNQASGIDYDVQVDSRAHYPDPWKVQVKEVAKNCPALPTLMENANIGFVHYTNGDTLLIIRADDLEPLIDLLVGPMGYVL